MEIQGLDLRYPAYLMMALLMGSVVGYERERAGKEAGMRTQALVCMGAALFTIISEIGFPGSDPARVAAQIIPGIGFIGAGLILRRHGEVRGLTTAAALWVTAAVGMAIGTGQIALAAITTILSFLLLRFVPHLTTDRDVADAEEEE